MSQVGGTHLIKRLNNFTKITGEHGRWNVLDWIYSDENHLQQNYIMEFVFTDESGNAKLSITDEWYENLNNVYQILDLL
jgi:hypothetical protein